MYPQVSVVDLGDTLPNTRADCLLDVVVTGAKFVENPSEAVQQVLDANIRMQPSATAAIVEAVELWEDECVGYAGNGVWTHCLFQVHASQPSCHAHIGALLLHGATAVGLVSTSLLSWRSLDRREVCTQCFRAWRFSKVQGCCVTALTRRHVSTPRSWKDSQRHARGLRPSRQRQPIRVSRAARRGLRG